MQIKAGSRPGRLNVRHAKVA